MVKKIIHEDAKVTAKKVRQELKKHFPKTFFSVKSDRYSFHSTVNVTYVRGDEPDHDKAREIVSKFAATKFDAMTDYADVVGYEYEGELYYGADYVRYSRS